MALSFDTAQKDQVASIVYGALYTNCDAVQKALIDDSGSQALTVVESFADVWAHEATGDNAPAEWLRFMVWTAAADLAIHARPDESRAFADRAQSALDTALNTFQPYDVNAASELQSYSLQNIRRYCLVRAARRSPRVFLSVQEIDTALRKQIYKCWNRANWRFRRKHIKMTVKSASGVPAFFTRVANTSAVSWTAYAASNFDSLATRQIYSDAANNSNFNAFFTDGYTTLTYADADLFQGLIAQDDDKEGKPRYFRLEGHGSAALWRFWPYPDQNYDYYAEIYTEGPKTTIDAASDTDVLGEFPADFRPVVLDSVYAKCLMDRSVDGAKELMEQVEYELDEFIPRYEDIGAPDNTLQTRDSLGDAFELGINTDFPL